MIAFHKRGFTLIELLLYTGLLMIFLLILTEIFTSVLQARQESQITGSVNQDGRFIMSRIIYDIGRAQAISQPVNLGDGGTTLELTVGGNTIRYTLTAGNLIYTDPTGSYTVNSIRSRVAAVNFRRLGNSGGKHTIAVNLTVTSVGQLPAGVQSAAFQTTVGLR